MRFKNRLALAISVAMFFIALSPYLLNNNVSAASTLIWPVPGHTSLSYTYHDPNYPDHAGIDICDGSISGANIVSACDGTVYAIYLCSDNHYPTDNPSSLECCKGFGTGLVIKGTDGRLYIYGHMMANSIPANVYRTASVSAGQTIGKVGNTGNSSNAHLHFQINNSSSDYWSSNLAVNPMNETYSGASNSSFGTKWEPSDDFYAFIIKPDVWISLDASGSNNNVQISTSSNTETNPSCIWRFEKQSNGAYVIYNQKNGYVLDAYAAGTDNGTNIYTYKEYVGGKNQQWYLYDTGSGIVIKSANCDRVLDCSGGYSTPGTNIQLWEYNGTQAQRFNVYIIAKRWNSSSYDPYAYLMRQSPKLNLENSANGNVQISSSGNDSKDPKQIWWFNKLSDGSFYVANAYNNGSVNAYLTASTSTSNGANVSTSILTESVNQKWYIYKYENDYGSGFLLRSKGRELVLSCNNGSSNAGTNINLDSFSLIQGQRFNIYSLSNDNRTYSRPGNPNAPTLTAPSSAVAGENISLSWTSSPLKNDYDARSYRVEVLDNSNKVVKQTTTTSLTTTIKIDTSGTYNIQVRAINTKYPDDSISSVSAKKTIVVSNPVITLTSAMLSSIPNQEYTGSAITPAVMVKDGSTTLKEGTDYSVTYSSNVNVGEATVTITGKGNYNGTVIVKFQIIRTAYAITLSDVSNGSVVLSKTTAFEGDEITVTSTSDIGYTLDKIMVNGTAINGNTFIMPAINSTVDVTFKKLSYTVSLCDVTNGTVNLSKTSANYGDEITVTTIPDTGYELVAIKVNDVEITGNTFIMPANDVTVSVIFRSTLAIVTQPENFIGAPGDIAEFSIEAEGEGLKYQWQVFKNGTWTNCSINDGAKTPAIFLEAKESRNGFKYHCIVTDKYDRSETSEVVTLSVTTTFAITTQPKDFSGYAGETATYKIKAEGVGLKYQWQFLKNGAWSNCSINDGAKTDTLSLEIKDSRDGLKYRCIVTDKSEQTLTSDEVTLSVKKPLSIKTEPVSFSGSIGETAIFTVVAQGEGIKYQWQVLKNGIWTNCSIKDGSKTDTLSLEIKDSRNGSVYHCIVSDKTGASATTDEVTLTVSRSIHIATEPEDYLGTIGESAEFKVEAEGDGLKYQWQVLKNDEWTNCSKNDGAKTNTLTLEIKASRNCACYRCVITDKYGNKAITKEVYLYVGSIKNTVASPADTTVVEPEDTVVVEEAVEIVEVEETEIVETVEEAAVETVVS